MSVEGRKKHMWVVLGVALTAFLFFLLAVPLLGRHVLFARTVLTARTVENLAHVRGWGMKKLTTPDGIELIGLARRSSRPDRPWLLFFGGNAFDLGTSQAVLGEELRAGDYNALVFAYRGYDGSGGEPSESTLIGDALFISDHLLEHEGISSDHLFLLGQSLGTGIAVQLAAKLTEIQRPPRGLVLLSPYASMREVFQDHVRFLPIGPLVLDPLVSVEHAPKLECPVLIIHGQEDEIIDVTHSERLAKAMRSSVERIVLPGRGHNDLWQDPRTEKAVRGFIDELVAAPEPSR